jgi:hypothetical protein
MSVRTLARVAAMIAVAWNVLAAMSSTQAATVAHWRFETGPANTNVLHAGAGGVFDGQVPDVSGNGNTLSAWSEGGGAGFAYRSNVPYPTIPVLGLTNTLSVKNTGGGPAMFTTSSVSMPSGIDAETMTPSAFTVEASYKPETGGHRTVVGRDARNIATANAGFAALYLQVRPDNSVGIQFTDVAGNTHSAFSAPGFVVGFNFPTDNEGNTGTWYNLAAVSDGSTLSMYVNNALVASTAIVSADPSLAVGTTSGGDWHAGEWSVGRGLFNGGHADRGYGLIDEVRISNSALSPAEFLSAVPEPATASLVAIGMIGLALTRRRA